MFSPRKSRCPFRAWAFPERESWNIATLAKCAKWKSGLKIGTFLKFSIKSGSYGRKSLPSPCFFSVQIFLLRTCWDFRDFSILRRGRGQEESLIQLLGNTYVYMGKIWQMFNNKIVLATSTVHKLYIFTKRYLVDKNTYVKLKSDRYLHCY